MRTKEVAEILGQDKGRITNIIRDKKYKIKKLKSGYWYTPEDVELLRKEIERVDNLPKEKNYYLTLFWNDIKDDNKRGEVIKNYGIKFDVDYGAASAAVNQFLLDESQRIFRQNKTRIEAREDGTIVQVYQSKINY